MENLETPFLTFSNAKDDPNYLGDDEELKALIQRAEALDQAIRTGRNFDILLDMLAEHNQDPIAYVEYVGENTELIIARQIVPRDWDYWQNKL